jgi:hypothetical protein
MATFNTVTPSDTVPLPVLCRKLWVGVTGNVAVIAAGDTVAVTLVGVPAAVWVDLPYPITQVMATNTTATTMVAAHI